MFLFEHILLTTRFKWCDLNDVYCVIMLTMMIKITLVYHNKTYKAYKVYNNEVYKVYKVYNNKA